MKLRGLRDRAVGPAGAGCPSYGTVTRAIASLLAYQATIAPSPGPITCDFPWSSIRQTDSSADDHLTQRVTSSDCPLA